MSTQKRSLRENSTAFKKSAVYEVKTAPAGSRIFISNICFAQIDFTSNLSQAQKDRNYKINERIIY